MSPTSSKKGLSSASSKSSKQLQAARITEEGEDTQYPNNYNLIKSSNDAPMM